MSTIDERVVRMTFDSTRFDKAIGTTLSLLEKFEQALNFKNAETGFEKIQIALNALSGKKASNELDEVSKSIDSIDGEKASQRVSLVQKAIDKLSGKHASDSINEVQSAIDHIDSKNATDQLSAVQDAADDTDPKIFQSFISGMQQSADAFNLDSIPNAVAEATDGMSERFSVMNTVLSGALIGLGNTIQNELLSKLNGLKNAIFEPMNDGFKEYQTQMGAIQTIMANTGRDFNNSADIAEVNSGLDELNAYADKTIYNFTEMTRNIGTFTAAGITMEDAIPAIKGVANMAAISGSNSQQASNAMYQLSQALSTGSLKLQDWNSVVNAGMGGQIFQDALLRTAYHVHEANGTLWEFKDTLDGVADGSEPFRKSLEKEWITSEVLSQTLQQMAIDYEHVGDEKYKAAQKSLEEQGYTKEEIDEILRLAKVAEESATKVRTWDQLLDTTKEALGSGWTTTWRIIIGDFKDATNLFTDLSNEINGIIGALDAGRNGVLESWFRWGGRDALFGMYKETEEGLSELVENGMLQNVIEAIKGWATPISDAFNEVFKIFSDDYDSEFADIIQEFGITSEETGKARERILNETAMAAGQNTEKYKQEMEKQEAILEQVAQEFGEDSDQYREAVNKQNETMDELALNLGKNSTEYEDAVNRLNVTFKNASYDEDYARLCEHVNAIEDEMTRIEDSKLADVIKEFGYDSDEFRNAVKDLEESDAEYAQLVKEFGEASEEATKYREDYLRPFVEQFGEDSQEYRDAVHILDSSHQTLDETFDISNGVLDWVGQDLAALTLGIRDFTETLIPSQDMMIGIRGVFEGLFAVVDLVLHGFIDLLGISGGVVSFIRIFTDPILEFGIELLGALGQVIFAVHDSILLIKNTLVETLGTISDTVFGDKGFIESTREMYQGFLNLLDIPGKIQFVTDIIKDIIGTITSVIVNNIGRIIDFIDRIKATKDAIVTIFTENPAIQKFATSMTNLGHKLNIIFSVVSQTIGNIGAALEQIINPTKEAEDVAEEAAQPFQLIVDIFTVIANVVGMAAEAFSNFVDGINYTNSIDIILNAGAWIIESINTIANAAGGLIGWLTSIIDISAIFSTIWETISTVVSVLFGIIITVGGVAFDLISTVLSTLGGVFSTIVDAISQLAQSFMGVNEETKKTEGNVNPIIEAFKFLGDVLIVVAKVIGGALRVALTVLKYALEWIVFILGALVGGFALLVVYLDIPGKIAAGIDLLGKAFDGLKSFIAPAVEAILDFVTRITDMFGVTDKIQGAIDAIKNFFGIGKESAEGIKDTGDAAEESAEKFDLLAKATEFFETLKNNVMNIWEQLQRLAGEIQNVVMQSKFISDIADFFGKLKDDILGLPSRIELFDETGNLKIFTDITNAVGGVLEYLSTLTPEKLFHDILYSIDNFIGSIMDIFSTVSGWIESPKKLIDDVVEFGSTVARKVSKFFPNLGSMIWNGIQGFKESIRGLTEGGVFESWESFGKWIVDWFVDIPNKISEGFNNFVDSLKNGEYDLPPHMKEIGKQLGEFLDSVRNFNIGDAFNNIVNQIKDIPNKIKNIATKIKNALTGAKEETQNAQNVGSQNPTAGGMGNVDLNNNQLENVDENQVNGPLDFIVGIINKLKDKIANIQEIIKNIPNTAFELIKKFIRAVCDIVNIVVDYVKDELIDRLMAIFWKISAALGVWEGLRLARGITNLVNGVGNLTKAMAANLNEDATKSTFEKFKDNMIGLAIAFAAIAATVVVLSFIKPEDLEKAIIAVLKIMGLLVAFYAVSGVVSNFLQISDGLGDSMMKAAASITLVGIGMVVITKVIDYLSGWVIEKLQDLPALAAGLVGFIGCAVLIGVLCAALSVAGPNALKASVAMIPASIAMMLLANVIDTLSGIVIDKDWEALGKIGATLGALVIVMIGLGAAMRLIGEHGIGAGIAVLALAASITIITDAIIRLTEIDVESLNRAATSLTALMAIFAIIVYLSEDGNLLKTSGSILLYAGSLFIISEALRRLTEVNIESLDRAATALTALTAIFGIITYMTEDGDLIKTGKAMDLFALSCIGMAAALMMIATIPIAEISMATLALGGLTFIFGGITALTENGDIVSTGKAMDLFALSCIGMAAALMMIGTVPIDRVTAAGIALGGLTIVFGAITALTKEGDITATGLAMDAFALALIAMAYALASLAEINIDQLNGVALALGALVAVFGVFALVLAAIPGSAAVVVMFGLALIELGVAADLLAVAFAVVVQMLPEFLAQVPALNEAFSSMGDNMLAFIEAGVGLSVASIGIAAFGFALLSFGAGAAVAGAGAQVLAAGLKALGDVIFGERDFSNAGENVVAGIGQGMEEGSKSLPDIILGVGKRILDTFLGMFGIHSPSDLMNEMIGQNLTAGIGEGITEGEGGLTGPLDGILGTIMTKIQEGIPGVINWVQNEGLPMLQTWFTETAIPAVQDWFFNTFVPAAGKWITDTWNAIVGFVTENWPKFIDWLQNVAIPGVQDWFFNTFIPAAGQFITDTWNAIVGFVTENFPKLIDWLVNVAIPGVANWFTNDFIPAFSKWIGDVFNSLLKWLGERKEDVKKWLFETAIPGLMKWAQSIPGKIQEGLGDIAQFFITTGENIAKGIKEGVLNGVEWVCNAITDLGGNALDAIKNFFHIASPSQVMRDEVGHNIGKGLELGILDYTDTVSDASTGLGESIGERIGYGIADGLKGTQGTIEGAGQDAMSALVSTLRGGAENGLVQQSNELNEQYKQLEKEHLQKQEEADRLFNEITSTEEYKRHMQEIYDTSSNDEEALSRLNHDYMLDEYYRKLDEAEEISKKKDEIWAKKASVDYRISELTGKKDPNADYTAVIEEYNGNVSVKFVPVETNLSSNNNTNALGKASKNVYSGSLQAVKKTANSTSSEIIQEIGSPYTNDITQISKHLQSVAAYTNSICTRIDKLDVEVSKINSNLASMEIYMDSGQLVGAIAPKMDNALGLRQINSSRGVIL